jgi:hypothetical protein
MRERPYHHGDLRQALIDAALELIEKRGVAALTLCEVARRVGVTHAAPLRPRELPRSGSGHWAARTCSTCCEIPRTSA